ncbi:small ribosomal subunit protein mS37 [Mantella aurantiaca]
MAAEGIALQVKAAKLLSRRFGKPVLNPKLPLALSDSVSRRREKLSEASCLTEMSVLMACWKENSFNDKVCTNELKIFNECIVTAQANRKARLLQEASLATKNVNNLLKKNPSIKHEI